MGRNSSILWGVCMEVGWGGVLGPANPSAYYIRHSKILGYVGFYFALRRGVCIGTFFEELLSYCFESPWQKGQLLASNYNTIGEER